MISFGFMMAARFASEELANGAINLASWPMMLLSGVWFSLEGAPGWLQQAAQGAATHADARRRPRRDAGWRWDRRGPAASRLARRHDTAVPRDRGRGIPLAGRLSAGQGGGSTPGLWQTARPRASDRATLEQVRAAQGTAHRPRCARGRIVVPPAPVDRHRRGRCSVVAAAALVLQSRKADRSDGRSRARDAGDQRGYFRARCDGLRHGAPPGDRVRKDHRQGPRSADRGRPARRGRRHPRDARRFGGARGSRAAARAGRRRAGPADRGRGLERECGARVQAPAGGRRSSS